LKVYPETPSTAADTAGLVRMITEFQHKRQVATAIVDLTLVVLAYYAAHLLRFEDAFRPDDPFFIRALPVFIICQMSSFALFKTYQGIWRYTGLYDLLRLGKAAVAGTGLAIIALFVAFDLREYSRAVFIIDTVLLMMFVGGSRILFRALSERLRPLPPHRRPVIIYGAGDGGVLALREIVNNPGLGRQPIGFIDDDRSKWNSLVQGIPVLGDVTRLPHVLTRYGVTEVVLAASLVARNREELERVCFEADISIVRAAMRLE
jgi:UDP-GlcNAc:undecaprenyl-phosphate GlcNAc-1-phosphate transferase